MIFLIVISLVTVYVTLLNFKLFKTFNEKFKTIITVFIICTYIFGLFLFIRDFNFDKLKQESIPVIVAVIISLIINLLIRMKRKRT